MSYFMLLDVYKKIGKRNNENREIDSNKIEKEILTEEKIGNKIIAKEFNRCKENLKLFSEQIENDINLPTVDYTSYKFFNHTVTGTELNRLTAKLQEHLIGFNNINGKIIKEFEAIYNTFNALDNEYIKEIMQSIEKSNEAINKANQGLTEAEKRIEDIKETNEKIQVAQNNIKIIQDKLKNAQQNIDRNIEFQKKIVEGLSKFKNKIDSYEHLKDIDSIWNDLEKVKNSLYILEEKQEKIENLEMSLQDTQNENISLSKKLNMSYLLGSGALILGIFNIFYLFLRG
ncbi:hypothetical protein [Fusobacterium pseudoperiodonticum]|uniref:coiled-coil domain-containing protein n=1 Tax=Fusobacterium pseudoperiodonticum TaxID=2663009 RepID=UPI0030D1FC7E